MKTAVVFAALLGVLCPAPLQAQAPPLRWGDVPAEHLAMDRYPADTLASAVVLADYGEVTFLPTGHLVFERHCRIKVLSEAGYAWGDVEVPYLAEGRVQRVDDVRGATYAVDAAGRVTATRLGRDALFDEDVDGVWRRKRFTLPGLAPGVVLEYRYRIYSEDPFYLPSWTFQLGEPVLWSEYRVEVPDLLRYDHARAGATGGVVYEVQQASSLYGPARLHRWVLRDVPALREEPFMTSPRDYRARLDFQLRHALRPDGSRIPVMVSWEHLADQLRGLEGFGRWVSAGRQLRQQVDVVTAGVTDPTDRVRALYDYVRTGLQWNEREGPIARQSLKDVLRTRTGSRAELALLLVALLREAGFEADPVLISTRDHGRLDTTHPMLARFNSVLTAVRVGEGWHLMDPSDPLRPYTLLPHDALSERGLRVGRKEVAWVDIVAAQRDVRQVNVEATLAPDGTLAGRLQVVDHTYSALERRHLWRDGGPDALLQSVLLDHLPTAEAEPPQVDHADDVRQALKTVVAFKAPAYAQGAGERLYFNPTVVGRLAENPLRRPERTFPVDHGYPADVVYTLVLTPPPGYTVLERPGNLKLSAAGGGIGYHRTTEVEGGRLVVQTRLLRPQIVFEPGVYAGLRQFYEGLVAAQAEQVVLEKVHAPEGAR